MKESFESTKEYFAKEDIIEQLDSFIKSENPEAVEEANVARLLLADDDVAAGRECGLHAGIFCVALAPRLRDVAEQPELVGALEHLEGAVLGARAVDRHGGGGHGGGRRRGRRRRA